MHTRAHDSHLGRWDVAHRAARNDLRAFVRGYVGSSSTLPAPVRERLLPSVEVPLFINLAAAHRHLGPAGDWQSRDGVWITGLRNSHQTSEAAGEREFMIVRLTPLGAHLLLQIPMHRASDRAVDLTDIDPALSHEIMRRVTAERDWRGRFDALESLIGQRIGQASFPTGLAWAWNALEASGGRMPLGPLAAQLGCSHRAMIDQFRVAFGLAPKSVGRLFRFNRAVRALNAFRRSEHGKPFIEATAPCSSGHVIPWAAIASDAGYFDQSHFIRDFRQFAGTSPNRFVSVMADLG